MAIWRTLPRHLGTVPVPRGVPSVAIAGYRGPQSETVHDVMVQHLHRPQQPRRTTSLVEDRASTIPKLRFRLRLGLCRSVFTSWRQRVGHSGHRPIDRGRGVGHAHRRVGMGVGLQAYRGSWQVIGCGGPARRPKNNEACKRDMHWIEPQLAHSWNAPMLLPLRPHWRPRRQHQTRQLQPDP